MKNTVKKFSLTQIFEAAAACVRLSPAVLKLGTFAHDYGQRPTSVDLAELKATIDSLSISTADLTMDEEDEGIDVGMVSAAVSKFDYFVSMDELETTLGEQIVDEDDDEGIDVSALTDAISKIQISLASNSAEDAHQFLTCVSVDMPRGHAVIAMVQKDGKCYQPFTTQVSHDQLNAILESADSNIFLPHTRHNGQGQRVIVFSGQNAMTVFNATLENQQAKFRHEMFVACGHTCMVTGVDGLHSPVILEAVYQGVQAGETSHLAYFQRR